MILYCIISVFSSEVMKINNWRNKSNRVVLCTDVKIVLFQCTTSPKKISIISGSLEDSCTVNGTGGVHHDIPPTSLVNNFTRIDKVNLKGYCHHRYIRNKIISAQGFCHSWYNFQTDYSNAL